MTTRQERIKNPMFRETAFAAFLSLVLVLAAQVAYGATWYISNTGSDANNGQSATTAWATFNHAGSIMNPGDTVYVMGGAYSSCRTGSLIPSKSGVNLTQGSGAITYAGYPGQTVTIDGCGTDVSINKNYIIVRDLNWTNSGLGACISSTGSCSSSGSGSVHDVEVRHCKFSHDTNTSWSAWAFSRIWSSAYNIHIIGCTFDKYGSFGSSNSNVLLEVGYSRDDGANWASDMTRNVLIEQSTFYWAGHHCVGLEADHVVFRNNWVHSEFWSGSNGSRGLYSEGANAAPISGNNHQRNAVEWNKITYNTTNDKVPSACSGWSLDDWNHIVRNNWFIGNYGFGLNLGSSSGYSSSPNYVHIYNNTFFRNGGGANAASMGYNACTGANNSGGPSIANNVFKNNIYYGCPQDYRWTGSSSSSQSFASNFCISGSSPGCSRNGDPGFADYTWGGCYGGCQDSTEGTLSNYAFVADHPDLSLAPGSAARAGGGALTTTVGSGTNSTTMTLADAMYFKSSWTSWDAGDVIQLTGSSQKATVLSVDYSTKVITLDTPLTWSSGQGVALANTFLYGSMPDQGAPKAPSGYGAAAYEAGLAPGNGMSGGTASGPVPSTPTNLRVSSLNSSTVIWPALSGIIEYNLYYSTS